MDNSPEQRMLASLIGGMAKEDPARAMALFDAADKEARRGIVRQVGVSLVSLMKETGDDSYFRRLLDDDEVPREQIVSSAVLSWVGGGKLDEGLAFIGKYLEKPEDRRGAVS